jgi:hypothetical protein
MQPSQFSGVRLPAELFPAIVCLRVRVEGLAIRAKSANYRNPVFMVTIGYFREEIDIFNIGQQIWQA